MRGLRHGWLEKNSALGSFGRASLFVLDTLRPVGVAPPRCCAHSMGDASSLSGGRILNCFPHRIARSAARTVTDPTLKDERAEEGTTFTFFTLVIIFALAEAER